MTHRLYYTDPYLRAFEATVARLDRRDDRLLVTLDRTAFYPTSGGQPFDTGRLGALTVIDAVDEEDGTVTHVTELKAESPEQLSSEDLQLRTGDVVHGEIDWARRFDHMQQHSGQHVLSAAFDKLFAVRTVSFHLGSVVSTIDLAREMSPAEIDAAESEANRIVWEDRPVTVRFVDAEEAARLPLRKEPVREGTLRLIEVEGFDLSACGGTHVARTGGIGAIAVASWERFKGGQRLEFLCGGRALGGYRQLRDAMTASVRLLSVLPAELPAAIERLQADTKEQRRAMDGLQRDLAWYRADELAAGAEKTATFRLVARVVDAEASVLKALATAIVARPGFLVALVSSSTPVLAVIARSADVGVSSQELLASLMAQFGGRGGGRPELAQGGGLAAPADAILAALRAAI
ncbi:MAG TPA: DHHA1 domain-containing protein [Vicinamibacterales bacterium]|jgi:alanyl-tRNA synthetase|nr:DHHA1 domain-containing protein [Vicinamibacterales bacterium]